MSITSVFSGGWAGIAGAEDRALPRDAQSTYASYPAYPEPAFPGFYVSPLGAPLDVTTENALRVTDAFAAIRVLADGISTLPLKAYRRTDRGRVPAGDGARIVRLLKRPSPGATSVDLVSQIVLHMNVYGEAFVGKYKNADGEIAELSLLHPQHVQPERRGARIVYLLDSRRGRTEHGPEDILHIKLVPDVDGLRGLSPVSQCRDALGLSSSLQRSAKVFTEQGSKPAGILSVDHGTREQIVSLSESWEHHHAGVEQMHRVAVMWRFVRSGGEVHRGSSMVMPAQER